MRSITLPRKATLFALAVIMPLTLTSAAASPDDTKTDTVKVNSYLAELTSGFSTYSLNTTETSAEPIVATVADSSVKTASDGYMEVTVESVENERQAVLAVEAAAEAERVAAQQRAEAAARASEAAAANRRYDTFKTASLATPVITVDNAERQAYVDLALMNIGVPYVWGGALPTGWDCSGFTSWTFKQSTGESIPRTADAQARAGKVVTEAEAKPGDLVAFKNGDRYYHIGIYLGDGKMVHAPSPGDSTKVATIYGRDAEITFVTFFDS